MTDTVTHIRVGYFYVTIKSDGDNISPIVQKTADESLARISKAIRRDEGTFVVPELFWYFNKTIKSPSGTVARYAIDREVDDY